MRILICGDRNWDDNETHFEHENMIEKFINSLPLNDTIIIEGEANGVDITSRKFAENRGITVLRFPADWKSLKRSAGIVRNCQMLSEGKPDIVVAFHDDLKNSKGTGHMVKYSMKNNVPVYVNPVDYFDIEYGIHKRLKIEYFKE